jgi:hypothetical protein
LDAIDVSIKVTLSLLILVIFVFIVFTVPFALALLAALFDHRLLFLYHFNFADSLFMLAGTTSLALFVAFGHSSRLLLLLA